MDGARDQILADAALTPDQDGRVGVGNALDDAADDAHLGMTIEKRKGTDGVFHIAPRQRKLHRLNLIRSHPSPQNFRSFWKSGTFRSKGRLSMPLPRIAVT